MTNQAKDIVPSIAALFQLGPLLYGCTGCGKCYSSGEFKVNKGRWGEYCKSCQRVLGRSAMKHKYTLQSKLKEIEEVLGDDD